MDERKNVFILTAALLVVALIFSAHIPQISAEAPAPGLAPTLTPAPAPKEGHRRYSPWPKDFLVWYA